MLAPPPDDRRRKALCRNPGCPDLGEAAGGVEDATSGLLTSLAPGVTAAPKEFDCSRLGLGIAFPPDG